MPIIDSWASFTVGAITGAGVMAVLFSFFEIRHCNRIIDEYYEDEHAEPFTHRESKHEQN